ncbi:MAG: 4-(cytidine 5'-diphospho)-2-C-methyl-D-erythritol kinase [Pseudomonadota bacterium]
MSITIKAPAKVNLVLRVLGQRPNGYHDLYMIMERLSLADEITLTDIPSGIELELAGQPADPGMIAENNLAYRAAKAFIKVTDEQRGVRIQLNKQIPVAAGLGGGSSDAAAVLKGLNQLWQKHLTPYDLAAIGVNLGADVPFFCFESPAIAQGIGEKITILPKLPKLHFLLINPSVAVSTPWVYQQYDQLFLKGAKFQDLELTAKTKDASFRPLFTEYQDVVRALDNDLEMVTIRAYPEILEIKEFLLSKGAAGALMSGSGPTVFGIFEDPETRNRALEVIPRSSWQVYTAENM